MKKSPLPDRDVQPGFFDLDLSQMTAGLPRTVRRVIETSNDIVQAPPEQTDFLHAILCQVGMPRSATRDRHFERANGSATMRLEAGAMYDGKRFIEQSLPYGAKPRLIMVHIGSQAVRTRSPVIEIGHSTREFMQALGLDTNGQSYTGIKKQINALAHCRMSLGWKTGNRVNTLHTQPIERFEAWLHPTGRQAVMWPGVLTLSAPFFETMLEYAVPLDHRALSALKHSALALDVYSWLAHRLYRIDRRKPAMLSWGNLRQQFGQEYGDAKNFKKAFRNALRQAQAVYPNAAIEEVAGGLRLQYSPPPIRQAHVALASS